MTIKRFLLVLPLTFIVVGCNVHQQAMGQQMPFQTAGYQPRQFQQQFDQPYPQQQAPQAAPSQYEQQFTALKTETQQEISAMGERVRRVERAMIRLDRRMQVLERNELVKVSGLQDNGAPLGAFVGQFQPTAYPSAAPSTPFAHGASVLSRTPFAARGQVDTQELNTQHVSIAPLQPAQPYGAAPAATGQRLASLADSAHTQNDADTQVAIWTVSYDPRKIWPDRAELAASSDVVNALRSGRPVNVFARGARPSSKEFRERVRALSRYLGRVANLESVPISAMPADHLNTDTIELLVAN